MDSMNIGDWITALSTMVIVIVTIVYAGITYRILDEAQTSRRQNHMPLIIGNIFVRSSDSAERTGPVSASVHCTNIGTGPALDVQVDLISDDPRMLFFSWAPGTLGVDAKNSNGLDLSWGQRRDGPCTATMTIVYRNMYNQRFCTRSTHVEFDSLGPGGNGIRVWAKTREDFQVIDHDRRSSNDPKR